MLNSVTKKTDIVFSLQFENEKQEVMLIFHTVFQMIGEFQEETAVMVWINNDEATRLFLFMEWNVCCDHNGVCGSSLTPERSLAANRWRSCALEVVADLTFSSSLRFAFFRSAERQLQQVEVVPDAGGFTGRIVRLLLLHPSRWSSSYCSPLLQHAVPAHQHQPPCQSHQSARTQRH